MNKTAALLFLTLASCRVEPPCAPLWGGDHLVTATFGPNDCGFEVGEKGQYSTDFSGPSHDVIVDAVSEYGACSADVDVTVGDARYIGRAVIVSPDELQFVGNVIMPDCAAQIALDYVRK